MPQIVFRFPPIEWDSSWEIYDCQQLAGPIEALSERDLAILRLIADGRTNREVAERLGGTAAEVKAACQAMPAKIGVPSFRDVVITLLARGFFGQHDGGVPHEPDIPETRRKLPTTPP
jgi:DNA-binding CsgD family transcriptional regulator